MNLDDMIMVSVDDHCVEPPGLFDNHLPAKYADLAPTVVTRPDGSNAWRYGGLEIPNIGLNAVAGRPPEEYGIDPSSYDELRPATYDINYRVQDMDAGGVLGSLNFPSFPGFAGRVFSAAGLDRHTAHVILQAYNDWQIDEWCGTHPGRMIPQCVVPLWDAELAAQEVRRVAAKGCHAISFPENPVPLGHPSLYSDTWDPLWSACSEVGTVVNMHIGSSGEVGSTSPDAPIDVMMTLTPVNIIKCATDLVWSPMFRRFPDLTVALSEGGIGWLPYFFDRVDTVYRIHSPWTGQDYGGRRPSEVFREHVILCYILDQPGLDMRHMMDIDRITWEQDYPHSDSQWPHAPESALAQFTAAGVTDQEINKITYQNAMRLYQYDPFKHIPKDQATVGALRARATHVDTTPRSQGKTMGARAGAHAKASSEVASLLAGDKA
jgi:predicted TIM-barrel fold metal-dependent hydrolase